jgi:hypothetical protein
MWSSIFNRAIAPHNSIGAAVTGPPPEVPPAVKGGVNLLKICDQTRHRLVEILRAYCRDAELFNGNAAAGLLQEGKTRDQHQLLTLRQTMRVIVEDVLWRHGLLTTDEIYRGVKAKHAQLGQLLPPRWQEEVRQLLEAHCISLEGNSWFLEKFERPDGASLFEPHGTSEQITSDSTKGQNRTDWASTKSYQ